ncbi:MAG: Y-family DNA polymerase [Verrucomicrobiota bacterium]|nr:Y-family DNA polymerase [Verrucomicrobiota bacterium]
MIALADCNNFYVSCERVFKPWLNEKPVIVLSNNDGCAIARSNEAKRLGIKMGAPYYQIKGLCQKNQVSVFSSNYELYGDMSKRVVSILMRFTPESEVYSIDESFLSLEQIHDPVRTAEEMRKTVLKWTGIPISVGIGPTKTLAKMANRMAKKQDTGCLMLKGSENSLISSVRVRDVWGIGRKIEKKLKRLKILTALDLVNAPAPIIRKVGSVQLERTQKELQGLQCISIEQIPESKKNVCCSRSFGRTVTDLEELEEAVANHAVRATQKIRKEGSITCGLQVFIMTNRFSKDPQYSNSKTIGFDEPSDDPIRILSTAKELLRSIYRKGYSYKKAGVLLLNLRARDQDQGLLFRDHHNEKRSRFVKALESIKNTYGTNSTFLAAQGIDRSWDMKRQHRTPRYTTNWNEIPSIGNGLDPS